MPASVSVFNVFLPEELYGKYNDPRKDKRDRHMIQRAKSRNRIEENIRQLQEYMAEQSPGIFPSCAKEKFKSGISAGASTGTI